MLPIQEMNSHSANILVQASIWPFRLSDNSDFPVVSGFPVIHAFLLFQLSGHSGYLWSF
jgi:hypothetical protein